MTKRRRRPTSTKAMVGSPSQGPLMMLTHLSTTKPERIRRVSGTHRTGKPSGLWLAYGTEWLEFCASGMTSHLTRLERPEYYQVILPSSLNLLYIRTVAELKAFDRKYRGDWDRVQQDYDGLVLTEWFYDCQYSVDWYYGWDIACAVVWAEAEIEVITHQIPEHLMAKALEHEREMAEWRAEQLKKPLCCQYESCQCDTPIVRNGCEEVEWCDDCNSDTCLRCGARVAYVQQWAMTGRSPLIPDMVFDYYEFGAPEGCYLRGSDHKIVWPDGRIDPEGYGDETDLVPDAR